jgi:hypothetical protein
MHAHIHKKPKARMGQHSASQSVVVVARSYALTSVHPPFTTPVPHSTRAHAAPTHATTSVCQPCTPSHTVAVTAHRLGRSLCRARDIQWEVASCIACADALRVRGGAPRAHGTCRPHMELPNTRMEPPRMVIMVKAELLARPKLSPLPSEPLIQVSHRGTTTHARGRTTRPLRIVLQTI